MHASKSLDWNGNLLKLYYFFGMQAFQLKMTEVTDVKDCFLEKKRAEWVWKDIVDASPRGTLKHMFLHNFILIASKEMLEWFLGHTWSLYFVYLDEQDYKENERWIEKCYKMLAMFIKIHNVILSISLLPASIK